MQRDHNAMNNGGRARGALGRLAGWSRSAEAVDYEHDRVIVNIAEEFRLCLTRNTGEMPDRRLIPGPAILLASRVAGHGADLLEEQRHPQTGTPVPQLPDLVQVQRPEARPALPAGD
jgi:hypothetical protein